MRVGVYHPDFLLSAAPHSLNDLFRPPHRRYTPSMSVVLFGMRVLEFMFLIGIAGSAIVVLIASVDDLRDLLRKTEPLPPAEKTSTS